MRALLAFALGLGIATLGSWLLVAKPLDARIDTWIDTAESFEVAEDACRTRLDEARIRIVAYRAAYEIPFAPVPVAPIQALAVPAH